MACLVPRKGPSRLTAWMRRHSSRLVVSTLPRVPMPALLTSVSRRSKTRAASARLATHCSSLVTSCARKMARSPMLRATSRPRPTSISAMATRAPSPAKAIAMARPRPEAPPVMNAALPASRPAMSALSLVPVMANRDAPPHPLPLRPAPPGRRGRDPRSGRVRWGAMTSRGVAGTSTSSLASLHGGQPVILELLAQLGLQHLAGGAVRDLRHEHHVVGQLPFGDLVAEQRQDVVLGGLLALLRHHDQERPLVPFRMLDADDRGLGDVRVAHRRVLDIDRADPLAAGFDHVLAAVDDLHIALLVDRRDVAGAEPALVVEGRRARRLIIEIAADDPRAAHQQLAARL